MADLTAQLDDWAEGSAAALVLEQPLRPVIGTLVFPPTFAPAKKGESSDYVIDIIDGSGVVTLDTPGSQANRLEPLFMREPYKALVPQVTIRAGNEVKNLLELGHRVADALARSTDAATKITTAFEQALVGDHAALALFAPTSLVFGAWDSRGTGAKLARLLESRIDAYGVQKRQRAAQYFSALNYVEAGLLDVSKDKKELGRRSQAGFRDSPSGRQPGGVEIGDRTVRTIVVQLAGIAALGAGQDEGRGKALRRYILGLSLTAATAQISLALRQGCFLVADGKGDWKSVGYDGRDEAVALPHADVVAYTASARDTFFGSSFKAEDTWTADKKLAQAEVTKRGSGEEEGAEAGAS